jgi:hypothetical protein
MFILNNKIKYKYEEFRKNTGKVLNVSLKIAGKIFLSEFIQA